MKTFRDELSSTYLAEITNLRRDLHRIPESGFQEVKTQAYIMDYLRSLSFEPEVVAETGVAIFIPGAIPAGKVTAIRTDMDGLGVTEEGTLDFASEHQGMMHACGHDGHMAIALTLAKYLRDHQPQSSVLIVFQPAEEGPGGADPVVKSGIFKKYNVAEIFGLHIFPFIEEGIIATTPGPMMAMTSEFYMTIRGKSGHAGYPDKGVDAIAAACNYVSSVQAVVSRMTDPNESVLLAIGTIEGGSRVNIIPEEVKLSGTLRSFSEKTQMGLKDNMLSVAEGVERMYGCRTQLDFVDMYPPVINDETLTDEIWPLLGGSDEKKRFRKVMLAEDFAIYQKYLPGVFIGLGSKNPEKGYVHDLHTAQFNFDEKILIRGLEVFIDIVNREKGGDKNHV